MIELEGLTKSYFGRDGRHEALRGIDLSVAGGEIFGIIGPSGAGKSTLVQCINLLEQPDGGTVSIGGQRLTGLDEPALRRHRHRIGMVFQGFHLMNRRTVFDNVALPLEIAGVPRADIRPRVEQLLALVGLSALGQRYPHQISGGQKQRVGIARALANAPDVLLSDEATSALDPETTASILALLRDINRKTGITIIMITHQMEVVRQICQRVAVLDHGRIVEQGRTLEVFAAPTHPVTRAMVSAVTASDLVPESLAALHERVRDIQRADPSRSARVWRLKLAGSDSGHLISSLSRAHAVDLHLVQARVEDIQGVAVGTVFVLAEGHASALDAASASAGAQGVELASIALPEERA